ncbi:tetratricopeptide repeat protein [Paludibacter sp. 221]|uniref:tetratricopeptide repeat protein n=1 Tax=Paludibacter sp. 221 TaxID=2302939 RepID=UPI0013D0AF2F|nr:tetratricopeptide repeat protein [Paludibacter sp. 221]NDV45470.1 tetratricopeptide repeat protein [Paludibacter sp. 221]
MAHQVIELSCPGCGARVTTNQSECMYCYKPIIISTFNSVYSMPMPEVNKYAGAYRKALTENPDDQDLNASIAMCYLKLKLYDQALPAFEKAIEDNFDNSEIFFYAAVSLLKGQKAFVSPRPNIDKIIEYLNAAIMIEPKGVYYYFLSYIKYDYFSRKYLNITPTFEETLQLARENGVSDFDVEQLFLILNVQKPECM